MLNILWRVVLFFLLIDCFVIVVGGGLWVLNVWFYEMFKIDMAKELLKRWNNER